MRLRNLIAKSAIVGAFVLSVSACTPAQQSAPGSTSSSVATGQTNKGPQQDPNLPPLTAMNKGPIYWTYGVSTRPGVHFKNPAAEGDYLGFDEKGSLIQNQGNGKVYRWNLKENSLTVVANNFKDVPLDVLASLQNTDQTVQYWLAKNGRGPKPAPVAQQQPQNADKSGGSFGDTPQKTLQGLAPAAQINRGPQQDPNLPAILYKTDAPIYWTYANPTMPTVHFKNPAADGLYLGFNENGSLIRNQGNGKVYYWKLSDPKTIAGTLTLAANTYKDVPLATLAALQNPSTVAKETLAMNGQGPEPAPVPQQQPPQNPDKSGGLFGDNPQKTLQGLAPAAGVPADITGKNASIKGGVLTFILADGSKSKPYTVVRPAFMANTPQAADASGTWIAMENGGKAMMFNVQGDNTVTGKEISPEVVQMLMQGRGKQ